MPSEPTRKRDPKHEPFEAVIEIATDKIKLGTFDGQVVALEELFKGVIAGAATPFQVAAVLQTITSARETLAAKAAHEQALRDLAKQGFGVDAAGKIIPMPRAVAEPSGPFRLTKS